MNNETANILGISAAAAAGIALVTSGATSTRTRTKTRKQVVISESSVEKKAENKAKPNRTNKAPVKVAVPKKTRKRKAKKVAESCPTPVQQPQVVIIASNEKVPEKVAPKVVSPAKPKKKAIAPKKVSAKKASNIPNESIKPRKKRKSNTLKTSEVSVTRMRGLK